MSKLKLYKDGIVLVLLGLSPLFALISFLVMAIGLFFPVGPYVNKVLLVSLFVFIFSLAGSRLAYGQFFPKKSFPKK